MAEGPTALLWFMKVAANVAVIVGFAVCPELIEISWLQREHRLSLTFGAGEAINSAATLRKAVLTQSGSPQPITPFQLMVRTPFSTLPAYSVTKTFFIFGSAVIVSFCRDDVVHRRWYLKRFSYLWPGDCRG